MPPISVRKECENIMKISRLLAILTILLNKEKVTAAELASRFEVSVRTILRDMQTISEAGFPIVSYQGYDGGYGIVEGYKMDKQLMNSEELSVSISILKGMERAISNSSIRSLIDKLEYLSRDRGINERFMVDLTPWGMTEFEQKKLTLINDAIQNNCVLTMSYINRMGITSNRSIEPLVMGLKMSVWYLYAYCRERSDYRLFKLSRIKKLAITDKKFIPKTYDGSRIFIEELSPNSVHLKLLFAKSMYNRVLDYFDTEQIQFQADGSILVEVDFPEDEWVYSTILGFGANVLVLEPKHIREIIYKRAKEIVDAGEHT